MKRRVANNFCILSILLLIMWGSYAAVSKFTFNRLDVFQVQFYSYAVALCAMLAALIFGKKFGEMKRYSPKQWGIVLICALSSFSYTYFYNLSLSMADTGNMPTVIMINYLFPVFVAIFSVPVNGERLSALKIISILISLAGAFTVVSGGRWIYADARSLPLYMLALAAPVSWGLFSAFGKRNSVPIIISNFVYVLIGFIVSAILLPVNSSFAAVTFDQFAVLLWLGLTNFILSVFIWIRLLKTNPSSKIAGLSFLTPFVTLMFVKLVLPDTQIGIYHIIGLALILAGVALQQRGEGDLI